MAEPKRTKKIKACPFCGKELQYFGSVQKGSKNVDTYVHPNNMCFMSDKFYTVDIWNMRPEEQRLNKLLAKVIATAERLSPQLSKTDEWKALTMPYTQDVEKTILKELGYG